MSPMVSKYSTSSFPLSRQPRRRSVPAGVMDKDDAFDGAERSPPGDVTLITGLEPAHLVRALTTTVFPAAIVTEGGSPRP